VKMNDGGVASSEERLSLRQLQDTASIRLDIRNTRRRAIH
jgi:hypothetical protein